jgi:hypothetical protein
MFANMISAMNKQHELQVEALKKDMKNANGGNDALMQTAISALGGMFGGGQNIGVSGFETTEIEQPTQKINNTHTTENIMDDKRKKINNAVVRLMDGDSEFAENISKLADLCENNPMIYKMAISRLENL